MPALSKTTKLKKSPEVTDPEWAFVQARRALVALHAAMTEYCKGGRDDAEIKNQVWLIRDRLLDITRIYRHYEKQYADNVQRIDARTSKQIHYRKSRPKTAFHVKIW